MADSEISNLPAVTTPASTDEFAVAQGGDSKKQTRAQVHALESGEHLVLPQVDEAATPTLSFGAGGYGVYSDAVNSLVLASGGAGQFTFTSTRFGSFASTGGSILNEASSAANPTLIPQRADSNTGIGHSAADNVSIIGGGLEAGRFEDPADLAATETSFWLYDDDTGAIVQVTVGIDDSGGAGFKLLRIAN